MKRCAKCGGEYADEFDACPDCAQLDEAAGVMKRAGCLLIVFVTVPIMFYLTFMLR